MASVALLFPAPHQKEIMKVFCLLMLAVIVGASAKEWSKPEFCKARDCPRFELVEDNDDYNTRKYASALWAWVQTKETRDPEEAVARAFALLSNYFLGQNDQQVAIPMTTPVAHNISLVKHGDDADDDEADTLGKFSRKRRRHSWKFDVTVKFCKCYIIQTSHLKIVYRLEEN
jgi:hypothetical protein